MKPSAIRELAVTRFKARAAGRDLSELKEADSLAGAMIGALFEYLEKEHDRRAAFEVDALERLAKLENTKPGSAA